MKRIKLFVMNLADMKNVFGEETQKELHAQAFENLLSSYRAGFIPLELKTKVGKLSLKEVEDTEDHKIMKYIYI